MMSPKTKDLLEAHLGYTALTNKLKHCVNSVWFIVMGANRLLSTLYLQKLRGDFQIRHREAAVSQRGAKTTVQLGARKFGDPGKPAGRLKASNPNRNTLFKRF